jgi:hypothetical protein
MSISSLANGLLAAIALIGSVTAANAQVQKGVSKTEVLLGTIQDLSGPIAAFGNETRSDPADLACEWPVPAMTSDRNAPIICGHDGLVQSIPIRHYS